jgi:hypothetical protein
MTVSDKVFDNLMWFLSRFNTEEIQVITEGDEYISVRNYLQHELNLVEEGKMEYLTLEQLDQQLEETINKHED